MPSSTSSCGGSTSSPRRSWSRCTATAPATSSTTSSRAATGTAFPGGRPTGRSSSRTSPSPSPPAAAMPTKCALSSNGTGARRSARCPCTPSTCAASPWPAAACSSPGRSSGRCIWAGGRFRVIRGSPTPGRKGVVAESITITDNRTGQSVEIPIVNGGVSSQEWRKVLPDVFFHDPGFMATAVCESSVTYLDGDEGILRYRGYPIEQLAEHSTYLEVAYLLIHGELPNQQQHDAWVHEITYHTFIHENVRKRFLEGFHYDAHPMGMLVSAVAALSTFYLDAKEIHDPESRMKQITRLIAKMPTMAAACHRFSVGMPFVYPDNSLGFTANFLSMMWKIAEPRYDANPALARALDILFILHADHEQNCSTTAMRTVGSAHADPYSATAAAAAALYGPRHGGANEAVIHMLKDIGSIDEVPAFIEAVKAGKGRLQGFGHRVYKSYDPRARIIK